MAEKPHVEEAAQTECGTPEPAMDGPTGVRQIVRRPAPAHLHHGHTVALLRQPVRRHAAAETGANYYEVEIKPAAVGGTCGVGLALPIP